MESTRLNKIGRLLQKELGDIFLKGAKTMQGTLITVTGVRVSADLSVAKVYISIFPPEKRAELLKTIEGNAKTIRYDLGQRVRLQLRKIPELNFYIDDSLDYVENIDKLLSK